MYCTNTLTKNKLPYFFDLGHLGSRLFGQPYPFQILEEQCSETRKLANQILFFPSHRHRSFRKDDLFFDDTSDGPARPGSFLQRAIHIDVIWTCWVDSHGTFVFVFGDIFITRTWVGFRGGGTSRGSRTKEDGIWFWERGDLALEKMVPDQQTWLIL